MAEVLVIGKKISEMELVTDVSGNEKIPTGVVGDRAVTTGQLLTYVNNNGVAQWGRIGGDITNQVDLQNQFTQESENLKVYTQEQVSQESENLKIYTQEQVSQQQVALQEHIDTTNEVFKYARDNGAALPYKEDITYEENAVVVKDGVLQQWKGGEWVLLNSDSAIKTWSGRTQEQKNKDIINVLDYGAVGDGVTDDTVAIQQAIDAAAARATTDNRVAVVIDVAVKVSRQRVHSTNWGSCLIVPSNVIITGTGCVYTNIAYSTRSVVFMCRGDNIEINGLTFRNLTTSTSPYDIPVGGGTTYDDGVTLGKTYSNIVARNLICYDSWISVSFQMRRVTEGTDTYFKDLYIIGCTSIARETAGSAGNFNYRSDPPHQIQNANMYMCTAKYGKTASSFNYVGIKGGSVIGCSSELNLYAACELENATEDIVVQGLRCYNDAAGLWIDDSSNIMFSDLFMQNTIAPLETELQGTLGLSRAIVWITKQGFLADPNYETTNIVGTNIIGINARIYSANFGASQEGYSPTFGDISLSNIKLTHSATSSGGGVPVHFNNAWRSISLRDAHITSDSGGARQAVFVASEYTSLDNVVMRNTGSVDPLSIEFGSSGEMRIRNSRIWSYRSIGTGTPYTYNVYSYRDSEKFPDRRGNHATFYGYTGNSPETVGLAAPVSSICYRTDDPAMYLKVGTADTSWVRLNT